MSSSGTLDKSRAPSGSLQSSETIDRTTVLDGSSVSAIDSDLVDASREIASKVRPFERGGESFASLSRSEMFNLVKESPLHLTANQQRQFEDLLESLPATAQEKLLVNFLEIINDPTLHESGLVRSLVLDLINPDRIHQGDKSTCTATSCQQKVATENPAEYIRLAAEMATNGEVVLLSGNTMKVHQSTPIRENSSAASEDLTSSEDRRTISSQLFQDAFMQYSLGPDFEYDAVKGIATNGEVMFTGQYPEHIQKMMNDIFNITTDRIDVNTQVAGASYSMNQVMRRLEEHFESYPDEAVEVDIWLDVQGRHAKHHILVTGYKDGIVTLSDPLVGAGLPESLTSQVLLGEEVSADIFSDHLISAYITTERGVAGGITDPGSLAFDPSTCDKVLRVEDLLRDLYMMMYAQGEKSILT